jgi:hypothetical protein
MSTGMTWFPISPGAPRNNKGEEIEGFIATTLQRLQRPLQDYLPLRLIPLGYQTWI